MAEAIRAASASVTRSFLGVVGGVIIWMFGFLVLARILVMLWPDYATQARIWSGTGQYTFTTAMSAFNVSMWALVEIAAGWIAMSISRRTNAVRVLAGLVMLYLCVMHLYVVWNKLPMWYNLIVALSSGPAVLLGGRLGLQRSREARTAGVGGA
jgi:hypothetical protein